MRRRGSSRWIWRCCRARGEEVEGKIGAAKERQQGWHDCSAVEADVNDAVQRAGGGGGACREEGAQEEPGAAVVCG